MFTIAPQRSFPVHRVYLVETRACSCTSTKTEKRMPKYQRIFRILIKIKEHENVYYENRCLWISGFAF